ARIDLHRVQEATANKLRTCDKWSRCAHIFLKQMHPVYWRLIGIARQIGSKAVSGVEELHAKALATPVWLQNYRLVSEMLLCCRQDTLAPDHQHGPRRRDAMTFQRGVLACLADLQIQRTRAVDHTPTPACEPGQHGGRQFSGEAVIARMG